MVKAATLEVEIGAKIDQFERSLGKVRKDLSGMEKKLGGVSRGANKASAAFSSMAKRLVAVGLAYFGARGIFRMAKSFLEVATSVEQYEIRLKTLLGSQKAATEAMRDFQGIASKLPFTLEEVIESGIRLTTVKAPFRDWLPRIADVSAAMGMDLPIATDQFARAMSAGLGAADRFRDYGVSALIREFAKLEYSIEDLSKVGTKKLTEIMFEWAGTFKGSSEDMAKTWKGTVSMLQDKWFKFRDAVMKMGVFEVLKKGLASFNEKLDLFVETGKLDEWARVVAIGVLTAFEKIIKGIEFVITAFYSVQYAINALIEEGKSLWKDFTDPASVSIVVLGKEIKLFEKKMKDATDVTGGGTAGGKEFADTQEDLIDKIAKTQKGLGGIIDKLKEYKKDVKDAEIGTKVLAEKTEEVGEAITENLAPAMSILANYLNLIIPLFEKTEEKIEGLKEKTSVYAEILEYAFTGAAMNALDAFHRLGEEGGSVLETFGEAMHGFVASAINALKRFVMEILTSAATTVLAKQAEAIAGAIASVMTAVGFPLNLFLVGGVIALVASLFSGLKPKKFEAGGYVPEETFAHLHPGERVLSAAEVRRGVGAEGGGITVNVSPVINIAAMDAIGVRDFMRTRGIAEIVDAVKAGVLKPELRDALGVKT